MGAGATTFNRRGASSPSSRGKARGSVCFTSFPSLNFDRESEVTRVVAICRSHTPRDDPKFSESCPQLHKHVQYRLRTMLLFSGHRET